MKTQTEITFKVAGEDLLKEKENTMIQARQNYHRALRDLDDCIAEVEVIKKVSLVEKAD
ncbi:hypothetical protein [Anaerotignum sp.]|uniref:hypothetical protein n=1 Tax=Anaerotignum sp. TaxID=2039241 RepID=UPI00289CDEF5|nr:hypothetical protein [Anaerotignum sp.]